MGTVKHFGNGVIGGFVLRCCSSYRLYMLLKCVWLSFLMPDIPFLSLNTLGTLTKISHHAIIKVPNKKEE